MIKQINRILKLVGLNLVRAKRKNLRPKAKVIGEVNLSEYQGESEWQNTPPVAVPVPNPGKTHYVGDDCPGGHRDLEAKPDDNCCVGYKAGIFAGNPNAAFVPVDIGVNDHEITKSTK